jgi:hypothetical protein
MGNTEQQEPNLHEQAAETVAAIVGKTSSVETEEQLSELPQSTTSFTDALAKVEQEDVNDLPTFEGFVESAGGGRGRFTPSTDLTRKVRTYTYPPDGKVVMFTRASDKPTEGVTLHAGYFNAAFNMHLRPIEPRTQITLAFKGKKVCGYVVNDKKAYFPIKQWPQELEMPIVGKAVKHRVKALIIG